MMGICDIDVMTQAVNAHVRRHDTYHDRFDFGENDEIHRYVIAEPEAITLTPTDHGMMTPPQIRKLLLDTPDPLQWDCFTFGIIQGEDRFTVYIAIDHLRADGMSAGVIFLDIHTTYVTTLQAPRPPLRLRRAIGTTARASVRTPRVWTKSLPRSCRGERFSPRTEGSCRSFRWNWATRRPIRREPSTCSI